MNKRFDKQYLRKRLKRQQVHSAWNFRGGFKLYWENLDHIAFWLKFFLRVAGIFRRGIKNSITFDIVQQDVKINNLPLEFKGFTILHLSDLHIDGMFDHGKSLASKLKELPPYDICVITGDFRFLTYGQIRETIIYTNRVIQSLDSKKPIFGILGNHDCVSMVPELEKIGIQMLMNESTIIKRGKSTLGIAGVDDSHFYETDDLKKASKGILSCPIKILLAHSQEVIPAAAEMEFGLYLCGHTHGGQLCLPGGIPIIKNTPKPFKNFIKGSWKYQNMQGYTSRGIGSSCLPVRYNCLPEIILHTLI